MTEGTRHSYFVSGPSPRARRRRLEPKLVPHVPMTAERAAQLTDRELDAAIMASLLGAGNGDYLVLHNEHADRLMRPK